MVQVLIDGNTMRAARQAAKRGEKVDFRDTGTPGLAIRVKSKTPYWYWITDTTKAQIAPMETFGAEDIVQLRALIQRLKQAVKDGLDPKLLIAEFVVAHEKNLDDVVHKAGVRAGEWTWPDLRDAYLEYVKANLSGKTHQGHRNALGYRPGVLQTDFEPMNSLPVKSITEDHIQAVLDNIMQRGEFRGDNWQQARLTHQAIRGAFKWATGEGKGKSKLSRNVALLVRTPKKPTLDPTDVRSKATATPILATPLELHNFAFQWMPEQKSIHDRVYWALLIQMLTGQRIASVLLAHDIEFVPVTGRPWRYVWALGPDKMGAYRLLPLPDVCSYFVHKAKHADRKGREENKFMFPQIKRAKGLTTTDGFISYSAVKNVYEKARAAGGPLPDTFAGTHDFRKAFTTHLTEWKRLGFDAKTSVETVTHSNEGRESVSQRIYNYDDLLAEKFKVLRAYEKMVVYANKGGVSDEYDDRYWDISGAYDDEFVHYSDQQMNALQQSLEMPLPERAGRQLAGMEMDD